MTYDIDENNVLHIEGNKRGLKLLARALLGVSEYPNDDGYHIHIDDLYDINNENKFFKISRSSTHPAK